MNFITPKFGPVVMPSAAFFNKPHSSKNTASNLDENNNTTNAKDLNSPSLADLRSKNYKTDQNLNINDPFAVQAHDLDDVINVPLQTNQNQNAVPKSQHEPANKLTRSRIKKTTQIRIIYEEKRLIEREFLNERDQVIGIKQLEENRTDQILSEHKFYDQSNKIQKNYSKTKKLNINSSISKLAVLNPDLIGKKIGKSLKNKLNEIANEDDSSASSEESEYIRKHDFSDMDTLNRSVSLVSLTNNEKSQLKSPAGNNTEPIVETVVIDDNNVSFEREPNEPEPIINLMDDYDETQSEHSSFSSASSESVAKIKKELFKPIKKNRFEINERVFAKWGDGIYYPALIVELKLKEDGTYYYRCKCLTTGSNKEYFDEREIISTEALTDNDKLGVYDTKKNDFIRCHFVGYCSNEKFNVLIKGEKGYQNKM